jgi:hypothetical protein
MVYIGNPILYLNYPNHFYIFFVFSTFASGTLFLLFILSLPFTFRLAEGYGRLDHRGGRYVRPGVHASLCRRGFFPSAKRLGGEFGSCWRWIFFILPKNHGL